MSGESTLRTHAKNFIIYKGTVDCVLQLMIRMIDLNTIGKVKKLVPAYDRGDGWTDLATLAPLLSVTGIKYETFGFTKLKPFIEAMQAFIIRSDEQTGLPIVRLKQEGEEDAPPICTNKKKNKKNRAFDELMAFAYFPKRDRKSEINGFRQAVAILAEEKALKGEAWDYGKESTGEYRILQSYLTHTFVRLKKEDENVEKEEDKKLREKDGNLVFNTGLVDSLFEPIYAWFEENTNENRQRWAFRAFVTSLDKERQTLTRIYGTNLPKRAHYYNDTSELIYNIQYEIGTYNWPHIIGHVERFPLDFLKKYGPRDFDYNQTMDKDFIACLRTAIDEDEYSSRAIKERIETATKNAIKRVEWNFKTAIPIYYPKVKKISLLLPLCLMDEKVDVALVLEPPENGSNAYIAHTILTLEMAYNNARLITRPDSDWLVASDIATNEEEEEEEED